MRDKKKKRLELKEEEGVREGLLKLRQEGRTHWGALLSPCPLPPTNSWGLKVPTNPTHRKLPHVSFQKEKKIYRENWEITGFAKKFDVSEKGFLSPSLSCLLGEGEGERNPFSDTSKFLQNQ